MDLRESYDRVAGEYTARIADELQHKPVDRALLDRFAEATRARGTVGDVGCGPGHVTRYLRDAGADVQGIDLSPRMVAQARERNPDLPFQVGDMRALPAEDGAWAGIVAFYSLIHVPPDEVEATLREFHRVLHPGGQLLLGFHLGDEVIHLDEWWGMPVSADFHLFGRDFAEERLRAAGFTVAESFEREPYPEEHPTRRGYVWAIRRGPLETVPATSSRSSAC